MGCITFAIGVSKADVEEIDMGGEHRVHLKHLTHDLAMPQYRVERIHVALGTDVGRKCERSIAEATATVDHVISRLGSNADAVSVEIVLAAQKGPGDARGP